MELLFHVIHSGGPLSIIPLCDFYQIPHKMYFQVATWCPHSKPGSKSREDVIAQGHLRGTSGSPRHPPKRRASCSKLPWAVWIYGTGPHQHGQVSCPGKEEKMCSFVHFLLNYCFVCLFLIGYILCTGVHL